MRCLNITISRKLAGQSDAYTHKHTLKTANQFNVYNVYDVHNFCVHVCSSLHVMYQPFSKITQSINFATLLVFITLCTEEWFCCIKKKNLFVPCCTVNITIYVYNVG